MKKLVTTLATLAFALSLGTPVFAAPRAAQTQGSTAKSATTKSAKAKSRKHSKKTSKASKAAMKDATSTTPQSK